MNFSIARRRQMHILQPLLFYTLLGVICINAERKKCMVKYDISECYAYDGTHGRNKTCEDAAVCQKTFNISSISMEPYNIFLVQRLLQTCCGACVKLAEVNVFNNLSEITDAKVNHSHFVFPLLGPSTATKLFGSYFVPFVEPPVLYYITEDHGHAVLHLIISCVQLWPVLVVFAFLVMISGFICWIIETWTNKEQFPRSFLSGWFEGFWWSFISMTTVGYGDKCPKTVLARVFATVWIILGVTIFSIITAMLSGKITAANYPPSPEIAGSKVGALKHRTYDASVVAQHGGVLVDIESENNTMSLIRLIRLLKNKSIDGFILDRYTFITFAAYGDMNLSKDARFMDDILYLKTKTIQTEKHYLGEKPYFGILIKNFDDYEFFADFIRDNSEVLNTCNGLAITRILKTRNVKLDGVVADALLSKDDSYFWVTIIGSIVSIVLICCFGVIYEIHRQRRKRIESRLEDLSQIELKSSF